MRLTEAIEALLLATRADGRSKATVADYRRKLRPFAVAMGDTLVQTITVHQVRQYIANLRDRSTRWADHPMHKQQEGGLAPHSIAGHVRVIKRLFNWLEAEGEITENQHGGSGCRSRNSQSLKRLTSRTSGRWWPRRRVMGHPTFEIEQFCCF